MTTFLQIDFAALLAATLAALSCALVGNFLVLTRRAMVSDALSHVMLPGVLVAYLVTGSTAVLPMLTGGIAVGLLAVALVSFLIRTARVDPSAALGVVFTSFFAGGVLLMEQSGVARTAFDVHHVITGNLEALVWPSAKGLISLVTPADLAEMPRAIGRLALILALVAAIVFALRKELAAVAFDPDFARASGLPVGVLDLILLVATALASVAAFESVGIVLAVAMIVCPPATARLLTDRLGPQIVLSVAIALAVVWGGYAIAVLSPPALGYDLALNAAGTIGAVSGLLFAAAVLYRKRTRSTSVIPGQAEGMGRPEGPRRRRGNPRLGDTRSACSWVPGSALRAAPENDGRETRSAADGARRAAAAGSRPCHDGELAALLQLVAQLVDLELRLLVFAHDLLLAHHGAVEVVGLTLGPARLGQPLHLGEGGRCEENAD